MKCFSAGLIIVFEMIRDHKLQESVEMNKAMIQPLKKYSWKKLLQENIQMVQPG